MPDRPLLMIPGPVEISDAVLEAVSSPPPGHLTPGFIAAMGEALRAMRSVWCAAPRSHPFIVAGSGTSAMEMAATNLLQPGDSALVIITGYFSERMAEMLRRRGVRADEIRSEPGEAPNPADVNAGLRESDHKVLFATHVDTSTGVRVDAEQLCRIACNRGVLSVFDGVCATGGERFEMEAWGAGLYLTASQKALGLPAGLGLMVASSWALEARQRLSTPPPLSLDWQEWLPIMRAYEEGRPSYFSTPATTLVQGLRVGLQELLSQAPTPRESMEACFDRHQRVGTALRDAWKVLGLELVPARPELAANTLSALRCPKGVGPEIVSAISAQGVLVAGGLHPAIRKTSFRVGHMGDVTRRPADLERTVRAVGEGLRACGHSCDPEAAVQSLGRALAAGRCVG